MTAPDATSTSPVVADWQDFHRYVLARDYGPPSGVATFFRGQSTAHPLKPLLLRRVPPDSLNRPQPDARRICLGIETFIRREFMSQAELHAHPTEISDRDDTLAWWAVMQHYGAPTRLLDWSLSPHVALYFAVEKNFENDGALWCLDFAKLHSATRRKVDVDPMTLAIADRDRFFQENQDKPYVFMYERTRKAARMVAQQHAFTVSTDILLDYQQALMHGEEGPYAAVFRIPADSKRAFLRALWKMNVTSNSLFPGLDGLGRHAGDLAALEHSWAISDPSWTAA